MEDKFKPWIEFRNKYNDLIYKKDITIDEIKVPNDIFGKINQLSLSGSHKAMVFCIYVTLLLYNKRKKTISNTEIKGLWGYSKNTKEVNTAFDACDEIGLTRTTKKGSKQVIYGENPNGNYFTIDTQIMFGFIFRNDILGTVAFYIYSYMKYRTQVSFGKPIQLADSYFAKALGIDTGTVKKYIGLLHEYDFVKKKSGTENYQYDEYNDIIGFEANSYQVQTQLSGKVMIVENHDIAGQLLNGELNHDVAETEEKVPLMIKPMQSKVSFMDFDDVALT